MKLNHLVLLRKRSQRAQLDIMKSGIGYVIQNVSNCNVLLPLGSFEQFSDDCFMNNMSYGVARMVNGKNNVDKWLHDRFVTYSDSLTLKYNERAILSLTELQDMDRLMEMKYDIRAYADNDMGCMVNSSIWPDSLADTWVRQTSESPRLVLCEEVPLW